MLFRKYLFYFALLFVYHRRPFANKIQEDIAIKFCAFDLVATLVSNTSDAIKLQIGTVQKLFVFLQKHLQSIEENIKIGAIFLLTN